MAARFHPDTTGCREYLEFLVVKEAIIAVENDLGTWRTELEDAVCSLLNMVEGSDEQAELIKCVARAFGLHVLTPSLKQMLDAEIGVVECRYGKTYIPLWSHDVELSTGEKVLIVPRLPTGVHISDDNVVIVTSEADKRTREWLSREEGIHAASDTAAEGPKRGVAWVS